MNNINNKTLIYIPSKGRADLFFQRGTFRWLKEITDKVDYIVTLEENDIPEYLNQFPNLIILRLTESDKGISYAHSKVLEYAKDKGYKYIFKHDDDIRSWGSIDRKKTYKNAHIEFLRILKHCESLFEQYSQLDGISFNYSNEQRSTKVIERVNARFQTNYMVKVESWHVNVDVMSEDFYATAMLFKNGGKIIRYGLTSFDSTDPSRNMGQNKGGLQLFDRKELALKDLEIFKQKGIYKGHRIKEVSPFIEPIL
ncbi:hypothetical protein [Empedobacter falsenii]|uniref:GREB1-related protein n=1 Tax=Empedobacter falsenii TaxID=343874 RepID=UPI003A7FFA9D